MALLHKQNETILIVIVAVVAYLIYKRFQPGVNQVYQDTVDDTANIIADIIGLDDDQAQNDQVPPADGSPEHAALIKASNAFHDGGRVDAATWRLALDYDPTNPVMLRAGKAWGYGWPWDYWGKDF